MINAVKVTSTGYTITDSQGKETETINALVELASDGINVSGSKKAGEQMEKILHITHDNATDWGYEDFDAAIIDIRTNIYPV